jgi:hypothetical protein
MKRVFLLGNPVAHSISPAMQNATFRSLGLEWQYELLETPKVGLAEAVERLRAADCAGANVTIPYKEDVVHLLDDVTDRARKIGAVNTIFKRDGQLIGDNTDGYGVTQALRGARVDLQHRRVLACKFFNGCHRSQRRQHAGQFGPHRQCYLGWHDAARGRVAHVGRVSSQRGGARPGLSAGRDTFSERCRAGGRTDGRRHWDVGVPGRGGVQIVDRTRRAGRGDVRRGAARAEWSLRCYVYLRLANRMALRLSASSKVYQRACELTRKRSIAI